MTLLDEFENRFPQESRLTPEHWALYRLIFHNSFIEHRKTTQKEICEKLPQYFEWDNDDKAHDRCARVWKIVKDNNESLEHDKIIISKNFEYWIGSEAETERYLRDLWKALAPRLHRYWAYTKKTGMDGQGKLFDKNGNPLNEKANYFHECFNDYDIELQKLIEADKEADKLEAKKKEKKIVGTCTLDEAFERFASASEENRKVLEEALAQEKEN